MFGINEVDVNTLQSYFEEGKKLRLLDVRGIAEMEQGMIPNAEKIPLHTLPARLNEIHEDEMLTGPEAESPAPTPVEPTETTVGTTPEAPSTSTEAPLVSPEAAAVEELRQVQNAVKVMMRNNDLNELANPVDIPVNDMHQFPDATTRHDKAGTGYVLYLHDFNGDGTPDTNYVYFRNAKGTYICDRYGRVTQVSTGNE